MFQTENAVHSFIETFANLDFSGAPTYCILLIIATVICLEGIQIYKMILYGAAFIFGFRYTHDLLWARIPNDEILLMIEVAAGLALAVLAWKIYLAGVGMLAFQMARDVSKDYFDGPHAVIVCLVFSIVIAFLAIKLNRMVIVVLTAVVGGFAAVNFFVDLIAVFPVDLSGFPAASSIVWLFAKVFMSAAGVGIQDVRE
ncbi:MAG: hypothetical protein K6A23_06175 [Butyrivibrio sp.]|nr:hypothetical protein [Butyrivibrio sp.]